MSSWRGLPDFGQSLDIEDLHVFPAADEPNLFMYLPTRLEIAQREAPASGLDFSIEAVRGVNPFKPPQPYGVLDFRVRPAPAEAAVLNALQQEHPQAALVPTLFARGWLRLHRLAAANGGAPVPIAAPTPATDFDTPVLLASNGLETVRCIRRLAQDQLNLLKQVLQNGTLTLSALAEMELWGLAARLPVRLDFVRADLLAALRALADSQKTLPVRALTNFWMQDPSTLPVTPLEGFDAIDRIQLAQTLTDWTLAEFGEYVAAPALPARPTCRLKELQDLPALVRWDLRQEKLVPMLALLELDPFEAARQAVEAGGLATVLTETIVPALETGVVSLTLAVNLPPNLQGVLRLGVDLLAPPHPPERVQSLTASVFFDDPQALRTVNWRFSPIEETTYQYTTFALVRTAAGIQRLAGKPTPHSGTYLLLSVVDLPLEFIPIRASDLLLSEAVVNGVCSYGDPQTGAALELPFTLDAANPQLTLTLPAASLAQARLRLQARSIKEGIVLPVGEFPARSLRLDLLNLPEYGMHTIAVEVEFDTPAELAAVDLLPEAQLAQPEQAAVLSFTPGQPARSSRYLATSPFHAGYVYRSHPAAGEPGGGWSAVQSPFAGLKLKVSEL